jgi:hypothetical protein
MASSTWEQQKSLGAFGVYSKRWIMEKIVDTWQIYRVILGELRLQNRWR